MVKKEHAEPVKRFENADLKQAVPTKSNDCFRESGQCCKFTGHPGVAHPEPGQPWDRGRQVGREDFVDALVAE